MFENVLFFLYSGLFWKILSKTSVIVFRRFRIQGTALINLWYCLNIPRMTAFQSYK